MLLKNCNSRMKDLLALALFTLVASLNVISQGAYVPAKLSPSDLSEDIRLLVDSLNSTHPGLDRYDTRSDEAKAMAEIERLQVSGGNEMEFYLAISRHLAAIRCDHTKAELPSGLAKFREENPSHFPFRFTVIDGRMYIRDFDAEQAKLERGTEILKINGRPVSDVLSEFSALVSVDGYTDHVKPFKIADDSDLLGADLDHFYPLRYGFGPNVTLEVKTTKGKRSTINAALISYKKWRTLGDEKAINNFSDPKAVELRFPGPETAYLRVATFINYRTPVDPYKVFAPLFDQIRERGTKQLIVDLRQNGGGSDDVGIALGRFLLTERAALNSSTAVKSLSIKTELRPFLQTWNRSVFDIAPSGWVRNEDGLMKRPNRLLSLNHFRTRSEGESLSSRVPTMHPAL